MNLKKLFFLGIVFFSLELHADVEWGQIPKHYWGDLINLTATPSFVLAFTATGASLATYEYADSKWKVSEKNQYLGSFNPWLANGGLTLALVSPAITFWDGERGKRASEEILEALTFTVVTTVSLKYSVDRTRPNGKGSSFPSGHTAYTFAPATVIAYEYPWYIGLPSILLAAGVGFARVDSQDHFASDVIAGAGIGALFATSTCLFHKTNLSPILSHLTPEIGPNQFGFHWTQQF